MTLNEFVRSGIDALMAEAATKTAGSLDDPNIVAGAPMAFFHVANALYETWLRETYQTEEVT